MSTQITRAFTEHPSSVGESYFEHMRFAARFAARLFAAAGAATVHAVLPFMFEKTASRLICQMHADMTNRSRT